MKNRKKTKQKTQRKPCKKINCDLSKRTKTEKKTKPRCKA